jgi:cysteinyl-tRNA synthetase
MSEIHSRGFSGELVRYIFLMVNFNQPLNWSDDLIQNSKNNIKKITRALRFIEDEILSDNENFLKIDNFEETKEFEFLLDNLNTSALVLHIQSLVKDVLDEKASFIDRKQIAKKIFHTLNFLGINIKNLLCENNTGEYNEELIKRLIGARAEAKKNKDFDSADRIRRDLEETLSVKIFDNKDGTTSWEPIK